MAKTSKPGDGFPLALVRKENPVAEPDQKIQNVADAAKETSSQAIQEIAEQLKALREQVQALQATTGEVASRAGHVVASGARIAGEKAAEGARIAGDKAIEGARVASDKAVAGAKVAGDKVTNTIESYPITTVLITAGIAFLLGRASSGYPGQRSYTDSAFDGLRSRLSDLSERLPPNLKSALRSSLH